MIDSVVDMPVLIGKMFELVLGVTIQKINKAGETTTYSAPPDVFAAKLLMEYRYGKPTPLIEKPNTLDDQELEKLRELAKQEADT